MKSTFGRERGDGGGKWPNARKFLSSVEITGMDQTDIPGCEVGGMRRMYMLTHWR